MYLQFGYGGLQKIYYKYLYVSSLFADTVIIMLNTIAEASSPCGKSENREFLRVIAKGFRVSIIQSQVLSVKVIITQEG